MLKILLPAFFIVLKLTGTFIDFMLGLSNSEKTSQDLKSAKIKNLLGSRIVDSFNFRTCVNPKLTRQNSGETKIVYQSLTAQDSYQRSWLTVVEFWNRPWFWKLQKFVNSDEGLPCVNNVEKIYLGLLIAVFALGILSLFRLSHFKSDLRRVFDPRNEFVILWCIFYFQIYSFEISD